MQRLNKHEFENLMYEQSFDIIEEDTNCESCGLTFIYVKGIRQSTQHCGKEICLDCLREIKED